MEQKTETPAAQVPAKIAEVQRPKLAAIQAGGALQAIVPQNMDEAWRLAGAVTAAGLAPRDMNTQEQCMVAIMTGLEVGLPPMQAVQSIAVIGNRPTIWGDGAMALVRRSGLCEWIEEHEEDVDGVPTAICRSKRKGEEEIVERTFSEEDQKRAGLHGKDIHQKYPKRMRQMRARAYLLRDLYADVLRGLSVREEVQDYDHKPTPPAIPDIPAGETGTAESQNQGQPQGEQATEPSIPEAETKPATEVKEPEIPTEKPKKEAKPKAATKKKPRTVGDILDEADKPKPRDLKDPAQFLAFAQEIADAAPDGEALETAWNDKVAAIMEDHDIQTQNEALGIYRKRERVLEP